ncbi:MAG TPA: ABC transporter permease [Phycisphaerales bacterium]|nr:ABC transporter permease [Phycisphaerales bacterium]
MNFVALRMLLGDKLKYLGLIVGISFASMLITQQAGILVGLAHQTGAFIRDTSQADIWLMDPEVRFSQDALALKDTLLYRARSVEGVDWAVPLYFGFVKMKLPDGTRKVVQVVGLDDATLTGGPPEMVVGQLSDLRKDKALLVDATILDTKLALRREGNRPLAIGDRVTFSDKQEAVVVGTYKASKSFFWEPMVYTTYSRAKTLAPSEPKMTPYVLVKARQGEDLHALTQRLEEQLGIRARTNEEFDQATIDFILKETGILINFGMAVALGFAVGALVAGQMLYNFTLDNLRYYGALKALGASNLRLMGMVLLQAAVVGVIGYGIGVGLAAALGTAVAKGGLAFLLPWQILALTAVAIVVICLASAALCLNRVLKLEAAAVFK